MRLLGFRPEDSEGAGDAMPFFHDGVWHVFFLKTPKGAWGPVERQKNTLAHVASRDPRELGNPSGRNPKGSARLGGRRRHLDRVRDRA